MKKSLLIFFIILLSGLAHSQDEVSESTDSNQETVPSNEAPAVDVTKIQKPKGRVRKSGNVPPNESSSFIGDPDNIDPLNPNRDNLKDDSEPVLEDIRDVLNSEIKKKPKPTTEVSADTTTAAAPAEPPPPEVPPVVETPAPVVETPPAEPIVPAQPAVSALSPDEPDLELEKKFHEIYKLYNINPTPEDVWAQASAKQTARLYEVQKGDTLWSISKVLFGDPNFWPKLWAINKQGILNPHFINPKMKILFYEGTEEFSPTLTVGESAPEEPPVDLAALEAQQNQTAEIAVVEAATGDGIVDIDTVPVQSGTDGNKFVSELIDVPDEFKVDRKPKIRPIPIPPSLPEAFNERYYLEPQKKQEAKIQVDLGVPPETKYNFANEIVLTDINVDTEVVITEDETYVDACTAGRVLKKIEFDGEEKLTEYDIYERLNPVDTETGNKFAYRLVGSAQAYKENYIKIKDCRHFMETELVVLPKNKMKELATQKLSDLEDAVIIGGPDAENIIYYGNLSYAFIDFGSRPYQIGQEFKSISEINDQPTATIRILDKFGSYAIGLIVEAKGRIEIGDKLEK